MAKFSCSKVFSIAVIEEGFCDGWNITAGAFGAGGNFACPNPPVVDLTAGLVTEPFGSFSFNYSKTFGPYDSDRVVDVTGSTTWNRTAGSTFVSGVFTINLSIKTAGGTPLLLQMIRGNSNSTPETSSFVSGGPIILPAGQTFSVYGGCAGQAGSGSPVWTSAITVSVSPVVEYFNGIPHTAKGYCNADNTTIYQITKGVGTVSSNLSQADAEQQAFIAAQTVLIQTILPAMCSGPFTLLPEGS